MLLCYCSRNKLLPVHSTCQCVTRRPLCLNRCQILRLKCTKFNFSWGSAPDPLGSLQRSPRTLAGFKGPTSKGRERRGRKGREKGKEGKGGEGKGRRKEPRGGGGHPRFLPELTPLPEIISKLGWIPYL